MSELNKDSVINKIMAGLDNRDTTDELSVSDRAKETHDNLSKSAYLLSKKLLQKIADNKIEIADIKDAKDIATIVGMLEQEGNVSNTTPEMSAFSVTFVNQQLGRKDTGVPNPIDVTRDVSNMSADEVATMVANHAKELDESNIKGDEVSDE